MPRLDDLSQHWQLKDPEERRILSNVTWAQYEGLLANLKDDLRYRVNYLDGVLEIVAPSQQHESGKARINNLLLIYFLETDTEHFPTGSTTFRKMEQQVGVAPDDSYCVGTDKDFPDLVVEIIVTGSGVERLERFRRLAIQEVWFWQHNRFTIYHLRETTPEKFEQASGYEAIHHSELLPHLDIELLTACMQNPNSLTAAKEFRQGIRDRLN